jgi:hypothetical protein
MGRGNFDDLGPLQVLAPAATISIPITPAAEAAQARLWGWSTASWLRSTRSGVLLAQVCNDSIQGDWRTAHTSCTCTIRARWAHLGLLHNQTQTMQKRATRLLPGRPIVKVLSSKTNGQWVAVVPPLPPIPGAAQPAAPVPEDPAQDRM